MLRPISQLKPSPMITAVMADTTMISLVRIVRAGEVAASAALARSQMRTKLIIVVVGITAVIIGLGFRLADRRSITRPLNGLARVMTRLASGDTSARFPRLKARTRLLQWPRTVIVFRDSIIERGRLSTTQEEANSERERRSESIAGPLCASSSR